MRKPKRLIDSLVFAVSASLATVDAKLLTHATERWMRNRFFEFEGQPVAFRALISFGRLVLRTLKQFDALTKSVDFVGHRDHLLPHRKFLKQFQEV